MDKIEDLHRFLGIILTFDSKYSILRNSLV